MSLPTIFKRGGQKKELFSATTEEQDVEELNKKLGELQSLWEAPRSGRDLCAAIWRAEMCAAEVVVEKGTVFRYAGYTYKRKRYLHIEEAVFLADCGSLLLYIQPEGGDEADRHLLSLQEAFQLMVQSGVPLERYVAYSSLCKRGYIVVRHPSCFTVPPQQTPESVWGSGAWAACYSGTGHSTQPSSTVPIASLGAAGPCTSAATVAGEGTNGLGSCGPGRPPADSNAPNAQGASGDGTDMDVDEKAGLMPPALDSVAQGQPSGASGGLEGVSWELPAAGAAESSISERPTAGEGALTSTPATTATPAAAVSAPAAAQAAHAPKHLPSGSSGNASPPPPQQGQPGISTFPAAPSASLSAPPGPSQAPLPPGASLFLVYDIYKPNASFSRRKPQPKMCSLSVHAPGCLPSLPDWWGLLQQSGGTPVRFAVADYGDVLFYDFGTQPIPCLRSMPQGAE